MADILIVEDDELLSRGISFALEKEGYGVRVSRSCEEGYSAFLKGGFSLLLLDINLPGRNGDELLKDIRKFSDIPAIFLTANDTDQDIIKGFELGCDDYIKKPFSIDILKRRISAVLRRSGIRDREVFDYGDIDVDFKSGTTTKNSVPVKLTATEFRLLELLIKNSGQVMTRSLLIDKLWDMDGNFVDENALNANICRLRKKLEDDPKNPVHVITVFGIGYTWGEKK